MSVSILVCCHNSAQRLGPTIAHILAQQECGGIEWEIVLVDNGSTDGTASLAAELLKTAPVPFTILHEPKPGKTNALMTGLEHCRHELISIVDDDNWVSPLWIRNVEEFMRSHPDAGMVGSLNEPVFEEPAPGWFWKVPGFYACGHHSVGAGDVTDSLGFVFGAGATFRKAAWERLRDDGFAFYTTTIHGKGGFTGEDLELCAAIKASGWRIYYDPGITLRHFMPAQRLSWSRARNHARVLGSSAMAIDPYCITPRPGQETGWVSKLRQTWQWQACAKLRVLSRRGLSLLKLLRNRGPDPDVLYLECELGALTKILAERGRYTRHIRFVAKAAWRKS